jgi:hypothetical protein
VVQPTFEQSCEFITKNNFSHLENVTGASDFLPDSILQLSENLLSLSLHPSGQFHGWKLVRDKKAFSVDIII